MLTGESQAMQITNLFALIAAAIQTSSSDMHAVLVGTQSAAGLKEKESCDEPAVFLQRLVI
jgi:hypothetical protein